MSNTKKVKYRYRHGGGVTRVALERVKRLLERGRLGKVKEVKGGRYLDGGGNTTEAVYIVGEHGTARVSGLLWGYGGEGPRGTNEVLKSLGVPEGLAWQTAFNTSRNYPAVGSDWRLVNNN